METDHLGTKIIDGTSILKPKNIKMIYYKKLTGTCGNSLNYNSKTMQLKRNIPWLKHNS